MVNADWTTVLLYIIIIIFAIHLLSAEEEVADMIIYEISRRLVKGASLLVVVGGVVDLKL